ncbi:unnamed protein product [Sphagnum troendelagicum]
MIGRRMQNNRAQDARQQDRWRHGCYYCSDGAVALQLATLQCCGAMVLQLATLRRYSIVALQLAATADNSALCNDGEQR